MIRCLHTAEWLLSRSETEQQPWRNTPDEQDPLAERKINCQGHQAPPRGPRQPRSECPFSLDLASSHAVELALAGCRETPLCRARLTAVANFGTYATNRDPHPSG